MWYPMNATQSDVEKSTADELPRTARDHPLGTDAEGATHFWDWYRRDVYVVRDGAVIWQEGLSDRDLAEWVGHIEERRGWAELNWSDKTPAEWIADALEGLA